MIEDCMHPKVHVTYALQQVCCIARPGILVQCVIVAEQKSYLMLLLYITIASG